jgi:sporulation protein YqfC
MGSCKNILKKLAINQSISLEATPLVPLIEICDQNRVLIENHCGIAGYTNNEILIKIRRGHIVVAGKCLKIIKMSRTKLVITGEITGVYFRGSC